MRKRSVFIVGQVLFTVIFLPKAESQVTITPHFSSPVRVLEGQPLTLHYSIPGSFFRLEFGISGAFVHVVEAFSDGSTMSFDDLVSMNVTGTNVTITYRTVYRNDSNDYTMVAVPSTQGVPPSTSDVKIIVQFKPENFMFKVESTNQDICKGDTFNITCSAEGSPAVHTYQLFEDGVLVQTSNNHSGLFWNKETTVGGMLLYTCDANNTVSTAITTRNVTVNEGRCHDAGMLRDSQLYQSLERFAFNPLGQPMCLYGDPAYPLRLHLQKPYRNVALTPAMQAYNKAMSNVRSSVEWLFGDIINYFKFMDFKKNLKIGMSCVGKMYVVCALLRNALTCLYGNQTSQYFELDPPTLQDYFA